VTETRRRALKMLGTIGATCAFPFAGDELYGQHVHPVLMQAPESGPYKPAFFTPAEYAVLSRLTDVIIPPTDTPGAAAAGVPEYIDRVVSLNAQHQPLVRDGLAWLERQATERFSKSFLSLDEAGHIAMLQPLSDEVDRQQREVQRARFRTETGRGTVYYVAITDKDLSTPPSSPVSAPANVGSESVQPVQFFRLIKNLTADGYYTSRVGLLAELGYIGNTAMAAFPGCTVREQ
jgi:gluconate 2-dehydrogenase gamma chain